MTVCASIFKLTHFQREHIFATRLIFALTLVCTVFVHAAVIEHLEVIFSSDSSGMCSGIYILTKMEE